MKLYAFDDHQNKHPWKDASPVELELRNMMRLILKQYQRVEDNEMTTKDDLARMQSSVTANTNATKGATEALTVFANSNKDLTQQLKDAVAASDASDDPDVKTAMDALDANTATLVAAVPATAAAIVAGTPAA